jgi:tetratricopeptide (TPR) repeat protein
MTEHLNTPHPPPEIMAAVAEGKLKRHELALLLGHIEGCALCRTELELVSQSFAEEAQEARPGARAWWIGAGVAATVAAVMSLAVMRPWQSHESGIEALAKLAPRSARIVEPRLSGGFAYAPYSGPMRAGEPNADAARLKLGGQAGIAIEEASRDSSAEAQHAAGVAYLLVENPRQAIEHLRTAANKTPNTASVWSDLAAAQYAAAVRIPAPSVFPEALASADRALKVDPKHAESLFNRALILERMGLTQQARTAWERYLAVDPSSPWAVEGRARLRTIPSTNSDALFRQELPRLEAAAVANDTAFVTGAVRRSREQSRAWGEAEFLGRWGEAEQRGDSAEAARLLTIARVLGTALRQQSGEALLADAVAAIDRADSVTRVTLADAHATYRRGRIAYSRRQPSAAEPELRQAATLFARGQSPMARMARYYAANTRFDRNDAAAAQAELEALLAEPAPAAYLALPALVRWQLALCRTADGDAGGAQELLSASASTLRRLEERNNLGFVESLLADSYTASGRPDDAWASRIRSFEVLSADGRGDRLLVNLASAISMERRAGHREAALSLMEVEREAGSVLQDDVLLSFTLSRAAVLSAEGGDFADAARRVAELRGVAARVADPAFRAMLDANTGFAQGAATLQSDPRKAAQSLASAARAYEEMGQQALAIDCHLYRARAEAAFGATEAAARTIDEGLERFERFRVLLAGTAAHAGVLASGSDLYGEAIRLSLDRGDTALAFGYADRARIRFTDTPVPGAQALAATVQSRLAGSGAVLIEVVVLPRETIVFTLDALTVSARREAVDRDSMTTVAHEAAAGDLRAAAKLYDVLVRPAAAVQRARMLFVVADAPFDAVPFAALYDTVKERYLVEQLPLAFAESGASLRVALPAGRPSRVLAMALPSGGATSTVVLAEAGAEVSDVAAAYEHATTVPAAHSTFATLAAAGREADVIHLSGHTEEIGSGGTAALLFAGERVPWKTIAGASFPRLRVVVLAACDTLRLPPHDAGARAPSLGGAFLAAGSRTAIGTLRPVGDGDARILFRLLHQQLGAGVPAADALRNVQLQAIAGGTPPAAWSALAVLTREIARL